LNVTVYLLLAVIAFVPYANSFEADITFDSKLLVLHDPRVHDFSLANLKQILVGVYYYPDRDTNLYRPLTTLSFLVNYDLLGSGESSFGYHCVNFALHSLNVFLIYFLATLVFRGRLAAVCTAVLFAVHPVGTEAVTNIAGRADLMAALAVLAGMVVHARGQMRPGSDRLVAGALFVIAFCGMLCKENAIVLLPLLFLFDLAVRPDRLRQFRTAGLRYAGVCSGLVMALVLRQQMLARFLPTEIPFTDNPLQGTDFLSARLTAIEIVTRYLKLLAWPDVLSVDYSYGQVEAATATKGAASAVLLLILLGLLIYGFRTGRRTVFFFGMMFFIALFPTSNVGFLIGSIMAERFLYLPLAGFVGCVVAMAVALCNRAMQNPKYSGLAITLLVTVMATALGVRTWIRNNDWQSSTTLFTAAIEATPRSYKPYHVLATEIWMSGDRSQLVRAIELEQHAVAILDGLPAERNATGPYAMLGNLWRHYGDGQAKLDSTDARAAYERALEAFTSGAAIDRAQDVAARRLASSRGFAADAIPHRVYPDLWLGLGDAQSLLGMYDRAIESKLYLARISPADAEIAGFVSEQYRVMDRLDDALSWATTAMLMGRTPNTLARFAAYYRDRYPKDCQPVLASNTKMFNLACPAVRSLVCSSEEKLRKTLRESTPATLLAWYEGSRPTVGLCSSD